MGTGSERHDNLSCLGPGRADDDQQPGIPVSDGYPDSETARRIEDFCAGASAAYGLYVFEKETFAAHLELYLNHILDRVEVINASVPGYSSTQELQMLVFRVLPFEPDIVILFDGFNDLVYAITPGYSLTPFGWETEMVKQARHRRNLAARSPARYMASEWTVNSGISRMFRHVRRKTSDTSAAPPLHEPALEAIEDYQKAVRSMVSAAKGRGSSVIVAFQPNMFYGKNWQTVHEASQFIRDMEARPELVDFVDRFTPVYVHAARESAGSAGGRFLDLLDPFKEGMHVNLLDYVHLSPYGHLLIAKHLLPEIESVLHEKSLIRPEDSREARQAFRDADRMIRDRLNRHDTFVVDLQDDPQLSSPREKFKIASRPNAGSASGLREMLLKASKEQRYTRMDYLSIVTALHPKDASANYDLALVMYEKGHFDSAIFHFREAIHLAPGTGTPRGCWRRRTTIWDMPCTGRGIWTRPSDITGRRSASIPPMPWRISISATHMPRREISSKPGNTLPKPCAWIRDSSRREPARRKSIRS